MVYPVIVLVVILGVVIFMLTTVVPQIEKLFADLRQELPFITQIMVTAADIVANFWWLLLAIAIAAIYFGKRYIATDKGRWQFDMVKLNVPLFGVLFKKLYMARFTRTGETLLASGVPMLEMLKISAKSTNNVVVGAAIKRAAEKVGGGKSLSSCLKGEEAIDSLVPQMINIGEQSGGIDKMMGKAADFYESEVDTAVRNLSTAIEPVLMVFLALVAGAMVAAVLLPVYGLINKGVI
jgi:type IV pilus assembly protein PilC